MFIDITEVNFNKTKEIQENNGIKTYDVSLNKSCMFSWDFLFDNCEFSNFRRIFSKKRIYFVQGNDGKKIYIPFSQL